MSAQIEIHCPSLNFSKKVWIERPVNRIGADPGCEITVPSAELAGHAFNLIFETDHYTVQRLPSSNGSKSGTALESNIPTRWNPGEVIQCDDNVTLKLIVDGDPSPSPARTEIDAAATEFVGGATPDKVIDEAVEPPEKKKKLATILAIVACFAGFLAILAMDYLPDHDTKKSSGPPPKLQEILELETLSEELKEQIRFAAIAYSDRDRSTAQRRFVQVRETMMDSELYPLFSGSRIDNEPRQITELRKAFFFVRYHLRKLK